MTELIGVICLGLFVGLLLGLGIGHTRVTVRTALTLLGAALGGAPIAFLGSATAKWLYPTGLLAGLLSARLFARWIDIGSIALTQKGSIDIQNTTTYQVFYRTPFAGAPQLQVQKGKSKMASGLYSISFEVIEQRADGFNVKVTSYTLGSHLEWVAVGTRKTLKD